MKKTFIILLIISSMIKADSFFSVGLGNTEIEYTDKTNNSWEFVSKDATSLILEYGDDDKKNYRKYLLGELNSEYQSISAITEWAPRFDFFPSWLKSIVGLPSYSIGLGLGYNNLKLQNNKNMKFISYTLNYNVMFEIDDYIVKVGFKSIEDLQNKDENIDHLNSDTNYVTLQYIF